MDLVDYTTKGGDVYDTTLTAERPVKILYSNIGGKPAGQYPWYSYTKRWGQYKYNVANFSFLKGAFIDEEAASGPSGPIDHDPDDIAFAEATPPYAFGWPVSLNDNVEVFSSTADFEAEPCCMLRHNYLETGDGKWKGWSYSFQSAPPTTQVVTGLTGSPPRNIEVFAITSEDEPAGSAGHAIIHNFWDRKNWHNWNNPIAADPGPVDLIATAQNNNGNLEMFAVTTGGSLLHSYFDGSWHPWLANLQSPPSNIDFMSSGTSKDGNLELFAIAGGALYHNYYNGSWQSWTKDFDGAPQMTSVSTGRPVAVHGNHLEVFGVGLDGHLYHDYFDGGWHGWAKDFDGLSQTVKSVSVVSGFNIEVFAVGPSGTLLHNYYDGAWHGWSSDFPPGAPKVKAVSGMFHGNVELFAVTEFSTSAFIWLE